MQTMRDDITALLEENGHAPVEIREQLAPAWSSDWLSPTGRERLREFGIAAPRPCGECADGDLHADCPRCGSPDTRVISAFGSTACKALMQCRACAEAFDYFKPI